MPVLNDFKLTSRIVKAGEVQRLLHLDSFVSALSLAIVLIVACALQIKSQELFDEWVSKLRHHRLYRQNEIAMYSNEKSFHYPHYPSPNSPSKAENASIRKVTLCRTHTVQETTTGRPPFKG